MAIASGLGSQLGMSVAESAYGVYTAPTRFLKAKAYTIDPNGVTRVQGEGLQAGLLAPLGAHYVETAKGYTAKIDTNLETKGMGLLLNGLMGGTTTPVQGGATTAYTATFTLGDPLSKSYTVQIGAPLTTGSVVAESIMGCKVTGVDFAFPVKGDATASWAIDAQDFSTTQSLASASYSATNIFHGGQLAVKVGTYGAEAAVSGVKNVQVSIKRTLETDRYYASGAGLKNEPILSGLAQIDVTLDADFLDKTVFQDRSLLTAGVSMVIELVGALIVSTFYETFRITLPGVHFEPGIQGVSGPGVLSSSWKGSYKYDGTNAATITTISTDTTL